MKPAEWILIDSRHSNLMRQKRERLRAFRQQYYRTLPSSLEAQRELRERVFSHLLADHPTVFTREGTVVRSQLSGAECDLSDTTVEPLWQLSLLIEEDFMLIEAVDGALCISAASNAYSSSGRLVSSVGRNVEWAHQPVPGLTPKLGPRIDRVLGSVHVTTPCERFNWQLTPMATVFFPHDDPHAANAAAMHEVRDRLGANPDLAGELLWIRVERQTLTRLPDTQAVAFSLHTYSDPLSSLEDDRESLVAMLGLLRAYSEERWHYSEMDILREPILKWLARRTGESASLHA